MPTLTPTQLGYLRDSHPHKAKIHLSVIVPEVVYIGVITGSPARGSVNITMIDVSGDITDVEEGMTIYVGTSAGSQNLSKRRLRSRSGQILKVDEAPLIWQDGWYFTVVRYWELWSIFPYIAGSDGSYTFYKDRDVSYTDQNEEPPPVAIMGSHRVGYMTGASLSFTFDGSDSYAIAPGASVVSYDWECPGGLSPAYNNSTFTVTYNTAGTYWVVLTVTDDNGKTQTTRRVVRVHDVSDPPYYDFEVQGMLTGSWSKGGWEIGLNVFGDADQTEFPDGTLVILWADQYFDDTEVSISGDNILFIGYIEGESVVKELDTGYVSFDAYTISGRMDNCNMYSVSLTEVTNPNNWNQYITGLTIARAVHHYLRWHSTLFNIVDVFLPVSNTLTMPAQDFEEGTLYAAVDVLVSQHGIFAHVCCDKCGIVHVIQDIQMLSDVDRAAATVVMSITEEDRKGDVDVEMLRNPNPRTRVVEVGGIDGSKTPYLAQAPGIVPEPFGRDMMTFEGLVLENQTHANFLCGRLYGVANLEIIEIRMPLAGNYSFMDIALQEWYTLSLAAGDTKRGVVLSGDNIVLRDISIEIDVANGIITPEAVFEPEAYGYPGVKIEIANYNPPDWPDPPILEIPPWAPTIPKPPIPVSDIFAVFVLDYDDGIYYIPNILEPSGIWQSINTGIDAGVGYRDRIAQIHVDCRINTAILETNLYAVVSDDADDRSIIYAARDVYNRPLVWNKLHTISNPVETGVGYEIHEFYKSLCTNPLNPDKVAVLKTSACYGAGCPGNYDQCFMYSSSKGTVLTEGYALIDGYNVGSYVGYVSYDEDGVVLATFTTAVSPATAHMRFVKSANNGKTLDNLYSVATLYAGGHMLHARAALGQTVFFVITGDNAMPPFDNVYKSTDGGDSIGVAVLTSTSRQYPQSIGVADDGAHVVFVTSTGSLKISIDGGSSWSDASIPGKVINCVRKTSISTNFWLIGTTDGLYYTVNFFDTFTEISPLGISKTFDIIQIETLLR